MVYDGEVGKMLYLLEHQALKKYKYAYKDLSLIGYSRSVCPQCSRQIGIPQYSGNIPHLILEGGNEWPDYLQFCGAGKRLFLISERALEIFEKNIITGYDGYQSVDCESIIRNRDIKKNPNYYSLNVSGRIDLDFASMHLKKKHFCPQCRQYEWNRNRLEPFILDCATWDGSDVCLIDSLPGFRVCSGNLMQVIHNNHLKGFSFRASR